MCVQPSSPMAPPITVPSVANAIVRTPLTVPPAARTPARSRSCSSSMLPSSKNRLSRNSGSRGSSDSSIASGASVVIAGLLVSVLFADPGSVAAKGQRHIVSAEAERIVDGILEVAASWLARNHIEIDLRVEVLQVQGRRDDLVAQGLHGQDRLHGTDRADGMAERTLGGIHRRVAAVRT